MDINKLIREERAVLKENEVYTSSALVSQLESTAQILTGRNIKVEIVRKKGYTGGTYTLYGQDKIVLDSLCELVTCCPTKDERFKAFMGLFYHELAHNMYSFTDDNILDAQEDIKKGIWVGDKPDSNTPEAKAEILSQIEHALTMEPLRAVIAGVYHQIENRIIDQRDENSIIQEHPFIAKAPVLKSREMLISSFTAYEEMSCRSALQRAYNEILVYSRIGQFFVLDPKTVSESPELAALSEATGYIDEATKAKSDKDTVKKAVVETIEHIWPFIQMELMHLASKMLNDSDSSSSDGEAGDTDGGGNSSSQSASTSGESSDSDAAQGTSAPGGSGNSSQQSGPAPKNSGSTSPLDALSPEQIQELAKNIGDMLGNAEAPDDHGKKKKQQHKKSTAASEEDADETPGAESTRALLDAVINELAKNKAEIRAEREQCQALMNRIQQIDANEGHRDIGVDLKRPLDVPSTAVSAYNEIMMEVRRYSDRLKKEVEDAFKETKDGGLLRHRHFGRRLCPGDAYRPDGAFYAKKALPQDIPEMAISILVDCSGSMYGLRMEAAIRAAVLLHDFATKLGIPVFVAGHCVQNYGSIEYTVVSEFERATDKDKYRIAMLKPGGCNRDGLALKLSTKLLIDRPEDIKLLFIISDGQPNDKGYGGDKAAKDIRSVVSSARSNGVEIFAAAIGSDKELIASIYGDSFIDISDLSKLPKTFTKIVKKRIFDTLN